jgi:tryptophan halogenase
MPVPESLTQKIEIFRHSGYIEDYRDGLFNAPSWLSVFLGQGLRPENYHPLADAIPLERLLAELDELRTDIAYRIDEMPKHATFLKRYADAEAANPSALHKAEARL